MKDATVKNGCRGREEKGTCRDESDEEVQRKGEKKDEKGNNRCKHEEEVQKRREDKQGRCQRSR